MIRLVHKIIPAMSRRLESLWLSLPPNSSVEPCAAGLDAQQAAAAAAAQSRQFSANGNGSYYRRMGFAIASLLAGSALLFTLDSNATLCQEETSETPTPRKGDDEADDENDPYEHLPLEDEETDCSLCNTFRKGPCRPYWRKLERCLKDFKNEQGGVYKCGRYFIPHENCSMEYSNLYQLISLDLKQDMVRDAELSMSEKEQKTWDPPVDWSVWVQFASEAGLSFKETVRSTDESGLLPLWKRLPENKEPVLLSQSAALPKVDGESGLILKIAFALDQDGFLLGLIHSKEYWTLVEKAAGAASQVETAANADTPSDPTSSTNGETMENPQLELEFFVLPGEVKTVRICGLYAENPATAGSDKILLDAILFKSGSHVLKTIADRS
jgi:hypothetical protein